LSGARHGTIALQHSPPHRLQHQQPLSLDRHRIETELFKYLAAACRTLDCPTHAIGGAEDHIHISCTPSRRITPSKLVQEIRQDSSKWIKTRGDRFGDFAWQSGYGAFSIGQSELNDLRGYIANQREHLRHLWFQDEFRQICGRYDINFDKRFA
jgi:putative transposase